MRIACLHTADVHVATFDQVFKNLDRNVLLDHYVDSSLLERARLNGVEAVRADVERLLNEISTADAVLCTCSTLGPLVERAANVHKKNIRIDRPLMERACAEAGNVLVAICLDSTRDATLNLLEDCAKGVGLKISPIVLVCDKAWAFFEAGDMDAYAESIAESIKSKLEHAPDVECVVLAQASMRVAETRLAEIGIPVFSSPVIAAKKCLEVARKNEGASA